MLPGESDSATVGTDSAPDVSDEPTENDGTSSVTEGDNADDTVVLGEYYYEVDDVAYYLHLFGELPENYITKSEAQALGWISSEGNLWEVAPGMCIGGDRFGNYEGLLPTTGSYTECDVNYEGGYRTGERLVFDGEGGIWYTADHYETFEQLYPQ
ncbi:MAG: ribonuclease [Clostridia bacterium]|nr:ribonuclease [Clostridia bacterium]